MYTSNSTFGLALACLAFGLISGLALSTERRKLSSDASWLNGYLRGKAAGQAIANQFLEVKAGE